MLPFSCFSVRNCTYFYNLFKSFFFFFTQINTCGTIFLMFSKELYICLKCFKNFSYSNQYRWVHFSADGEELIFGFLEYMQFFFLPYIRLKLWGTREERKQKKKKAQAQAVWWWCNMLVKKSSNCLVLWLASALYLYDCLWSVGSGLHSVGVPDWWSSLYAELTWIFKEKRVVTELTAH